VKESAELWNDVNNATGFQDSVGLNLDEEISKLRAEIAEFEPRVQKLEMSKYWGRT
jgi:hypothetical protein